VLLQQTCKLEPRTALIHPFWAPGTDTSGPSIINRGTQVLPLTHFLEVTRTRTPSVFRSTVSCMFRPYVDFTVWLRAGGHADHKCTQKCKVVSQPKMKHCYRNRSTTTSPLTMPLTKPSSSGERPAPHQRSRYPTAVGHDIAAREPTDIQAWNDAVLGLT
jgi:hypothetical protein